MKTFFLTFVLLCSAFSINTLIANDGERKEILLRLPLLSDKNASIISNALDTVKGIEGIEASYEIKVMIIGYNNDIIKDESVIMILLNNLKINTTIEKIYSRDIPLIREKYKLINLRTNHIEIY